MAELGIPLERLDLVSIAAAMDDHDDLTEWWFDPTTGETIPAMDEFVSGVPDDLETTDLIRIESGSSRAAYLDRVDFAAAIGDPRARDRLERALEGRGAFRRFRDAMAAFPELETPWNDFERLRSECRALDWLEAEQLADRQLIAEALSRRLAGIDGIVAGLAAHAEPADADGITIARTDLLDRWHEAVATIDAGSSVLITDGGSPWARLEPDVDRRRER